MFANGISLLNRFEQLRRELDRALETANYPLAAFGGIEPRAFPPVNVWDAGDTLCVEAELPGVHKDDVELLAVGNELTVKGRRGAQDEQGQTFHRRERALGEFTRTITLPVDVNPDRIEAVLENGVLTLRLPKAEAARPRRIPVKVG